MYIRGTQYRFNIAIRLINLMNMICFMNINRQTHAHPHIQHVEKSWSL